MSSAEITSDMSEIAKSNCEKLMRLSRKNALPGSGNFGAPVLSPGSEFSGDMASTDGRLASE